MLKTCSAHLDKVIFKTAYYAEQYMKTYHPKTLFQVYPCPDLPLDAEEHFHIRNKTKRNQRGKRKRKEQ